MADPERPLSAPEPPTRPRRTVLRARCIARASGGFGVAAALMVLAGWWFDVPVLRRIVPGQPPTVVLTAVGVLLLGSALLAATAAGASGTIGRAGRWLAAAAAVGFGGC